VPRTFVSLSRRQEIAPGVIVITVKSTPERPDRFYARFYDDSSTIPSTREPIADLCPSESDTTLTSGIYITTRAIRSSAKQKSLSFVKSCAEGIGRPPVIDR